MFGRRFLARRLYNCLRRGCDEGSSRRVSVKLPLRGHDEGSIHNIFTKQHLHHSTRRTIFPLTNVFVAIVSATRSSYTYTTTGVLLLTSENVNWRNEFRTKFFKFVPANMRFVRCFLRVMLALFVSARLMIIPSAAGQHDASAQIHHAGTTLLHKGPPASIQENPTTPHHDRGGSESSPVQVAGLGTTADAGDGIPTAEFFEAEEERLSELLDRPPLSAAELEVLLQNNKSTTHIDVHKHR